jgi:hypothetical protein
MTSVGVNQQDDFQQLKSNSSNTNAFLFFQKQFEIHDRNQYIRSTNILPKNLRSLYTV